MATYGVTTFQFDDATIRGTLKETFRTRYQEGTPIWQKCGFKKETTDSPFEEMSDFSGLGLAPRKEQFEQIAIDVPKQNYTKRINVLQYAIMVPVSEEALRFLRKGKSNIKQFLKPSQMVADSIKVTNEILAADVFGNAFSSTLGLGPDGQPLVSASHKLGRGGTASNSLGAVSLSQTGLEAALIVDAKIPDDAGIPVGNPEGRKIIVINEDEKFNAKRILSSALQSDNNLNAENALKDVDLMPQANRFLSSTSNWFMVNTQVESCLICLVEQEADLREHGDDKRYAMYFSAYESIAFDWFNWRGCIGSSF